MPFVIGTPVSSSSPAVSETSANVPGSAQFPPQFAYPMRIDSTTGDFLQVEQDSIDEVRQSVYTLMRTPLGVRPLSPEVGIDDPTFTDVDPDALAATLEDQEGRATVTVTVNPPDGSGEVTLDVDVQLSSDPPMSVEV